MYQESSRKLVKDAKIRHFSLLFWSFSVKSDRFGQKWPIISRDIAGIIDTFIPLLSTLGLPDLEQETHFSSKNTTFQQNREKVTKSFFWQSAESDEELRKSAKRVKNLLWKSAKNAKNARKIKA